jgi:hypothetical protein
MKLVHEIRFEIKLPTVTAKCWGVFDANSGTRLVTGWREKQIT